MSRAGSIVRGACVGERMGVGGGLFRVAEQDAIDDGGRAFDPWARGWAAGSPGQRLRRSLRKSDDRVRRLSGRAVEWPRTPNDVALGGGRRGRQMNTRKRSQQLNTHH